MIGDILQPTHLLVIMLVALLVLGPKRLPEVGRSLGKGLRDFRGAMAGIEEHTSNLLGSDDDDDDASDKVGGPSQSMVTEDAPPAEPEPVQPAVAASPVAAAPIPTASAAATPSDSPPVQDSEPDPSEYAD